MGNWSLRVIPILILIAITIAIAALIFVIVVILNPHWEWFKNFPYMRESVTALSTAAMVVATLFLAYATFSIISSDREREKRDREERLLKEIVDWAVNVKACGLGKVVRDIAPLTEKQRSVYFIALVSEKIGDFKIVLARGDFILKLSVKFFKGDFKKAMERLVGALYDHIELQEKLLKLVSKPITTQTFEDFRKSVEHINDVVVIKEVNDKVWKIGANAAIDHKKEKLDPFVANVIDEATKLIPK